MDIREARKAKVIDDFHTKQDKLIETLKNKLALIDQMEG